jgi:hypothetical protein
MKELIEIQNELNYKKNNYGKSVDDEMLAYIKDNFIYNPENGVIKRTDRKGGTGSIDKYGYLIIKIKGAQFKAHRIAWFLYYGSMPEQNLDHINGNKTDNRISNLREANQFINTNNVERPVNRDTGCVGIYIDNSTIGLKSKYTTRIFNKTYRFRTLSDAIKFRKDHGKAV